MFLKCLNLNQNASIIISLAIILISGFLFTRITKKAKLPNVTGFILVGILIGPHMLNLLPNSIIEGMDFVVDIALAFIAFSVGRYLKLSTLRANKSQVLIITLCESLIAGAIVSLSMIFIFRLPVPFALLLGAIGSATAPASTIMTIRQYGAKGNFVNTLLQVVALDDAVALIAFSVCAAMVQQTLGSSAEVDFLVFLKPVLLNILAIAFGAFAGFILSKLINSKRTKDNRLILTISMIFFITGFCSALDISPLLACMAMGTAYINISQSEIVFEQINNFSPPILTTFFVLSGMRLSLPSLVSAGIIGVAYFLIRIIGKYMGAYIGGTLSKATPEVTNYLGLALVPQAGVSIGLAFLGYRMLPEDMGSLLLTIILSSGVLYEMVGPAIAKLALYLSKSIPSKDKAKKRFFHATNVQHINHQNTINY